MQRVKSVWDNLELSLCVVFFAIMFVVLLVQVVMRYVFSSGLVWIDEVAKFSFQWLIYLSLSMAMKGDEHIRVDTVLKLWPRPLRKIVPIIGNIVLLVFGIFMTYQGFIYTMNIFRQGALGSAFRIPLGWVYLAIPVGYLLMSVHLIERIVRIVRALFSANESGSEETKQKEE
ncbi:MAG: TRAP transporter small permease [Clostridiales bacterium]|nr:TRAP transporter small permease [Clostridiales bacterium]